MRLGAGHHVLPRCRRTLASGLAEARAEPGREVVRDGVIQRFDHTDALSRKVPRRFLEETEAVPERISEMSFPALIRLGSEQASS